MFCGQYASKKSPFWGHSSIHKLTIYEKLLNLLKLSSYSKIEQLAYFLFVDRPQ